MEGVCGLRSSAAVSAIVVFETSKIFGGRQRYGLRQRYGGKWHDRRSTIPRYHTISYSYFFGSLPGRS
jgi:hypothetical protein